MGKNCQEPRARKIEKKYDRFEKSISIHKNFIHNTNDGGSARVALLSSNYWGFEDLNFKTEADHLEIENIKLQIIRSLEIATTLPKNDTAPSKMSSSLDDAEKSSSDKYYYAKRYSEIFKKAVTCETDDECVVVNGFCCFQSVNRKHAEEFITARDAMKKEGTSVCIVDCSSRIDFKAKCEANQCVLY